MGHIIYLLESKNYATYERASNAELLNNYVSIDNEPPYITATRMELDNSKVNVIFSDHMSSTLQQKLFQFIFKWQVSKPNFPNSNKYNC